MMCSTTCVSIATYKVMTYWWWGWHATITTTIITHTQCMSVGTVLNASWLVTMCSVVSRWSVCQWSMRHGLWLCVQWSVGQWSTRHGLRLCAQRSVSGQSVSGQCVMACDCVFSGQSVSGQHVMACDCVLSGQSAVSLSVVNTSWLVTMCSVVTKSLTSSSHLAPHVTTLCKSLLTTELYGATEVPRFTMCVITSIASEPILAEPMHWLDSWTCALLHNNPGQVVHSLMCLCYYKV